VISDARASDLGSILRDVTASTKKLNSHSKAAGPRNQRLCLVPHTCRFLGQQSLGCRTGGEVLVMRVLHLRPHPSVQEKGDARSDQGRIAPAKRFFCGESRVPALNYYARNVDGLFGQRSRTICVFMTPFTLGRTILALRRRRRMYPSSRSRLLGLGEIAGRLKSFPVISFWASEKKNGPNTLPQKCRGQVARLLFAGHWGRVLTTSPIDADNVTHSGKICGSPRFALFHIAAL
jgi:hypothetical protein